jgi:2-oxoisovalerate dehydrogenase E1 component
LLYTARILADTGVMSPADFLEHYLAIEASVMDTAERAIARPKLAKAAEVMDNLVPPKRTAKPAAHIEPATRDAAFGADLSQTEKPQHMARLLSWALTDLMLQHPRNRDRGRGCGAQGRRLQRHRQAAFPVR